MTIQVDDRIPEASLKQLTVGGIQDVSTGEIFGGKKVVLFAVPGAFTGTCSNTHLPGFQVAADKLRAKGVDAIVCVAVNDPFVMAAWGEAKNVGDDIQLYSDGNREFAEALGLVLDGSAFGLGKRSKRYAAVVDDGVVRYLGVEPGGAVGVSGADAVLAAL